VTSVICEMGDLTAGPSDAIQETAEQQL